MKIYLLLFSILFIHSAYAQTITKESLTDTAHISKLVHYGVIVIPIVTDRPDVAESAQPVPIKHLQIETGAAYFMDKEADLKTTTFLYNTTLLRYGIANNMELRLISNFKKDTYTLTQYDVESNQSGMDVLTVGTKIGIKINSKFFQKTAILAHLSLNKISSPEFRTPSPAHNIIFANTTALTDKVGLGINLGTGWNGFDSSISGLYAFSLAYSVTSRIGAFVEIYGDWPQGLGMRSNTDFGITYLPHPHFQIDLSGGFGLTDNTTDAFISGGISYLFNLLK